MITDPARAALAELVAFLDADLSTGSRERGRGIWAAARAALAQPVVTAKTVGHDSRILHELAGSVSVCWEPRPTGVFDSQRAIGFVEAALKELRESATQEKPGPSQSEPVAG